VLEPVFEKMGFTWWPRHRSKDVTCCTARATSTSSSTASPQRGWLLRRRTWPVGLRHGLSREGLAPRPTRALELGAQPVEIPTGPMELRLPAIKGIGGAPLYLIDRFEDGKSIYDIDFDFIDGWTATRWAMA
jgi:4-hydroxyphenylpyruvate dioxygenase